MSSSKKGQLVFVVSLTFFGDNVTTELYESIFESKEKILIRTNKTNNKNKIFITGNTSIDFLKIQKIKNTIKDYDIVVCMTNKDSQKITKPIIDYLDEK